MSSLPSSLLGVTPQKPADKWNHWLTSLYLGARCFLSAVRLQILLNVILRFWECNNNNCINTLFRITVITVGSKELPLKLRVGEYFYMSSKKLVLRKQNTFWKPTNYQLFIKNESCAHPIIQVKGVPDSLTEITILGTSRLMTPLNLILGESS